MALFRPKMRDLEVERRTQEDSKGDKISSEVSLDPGSCLTAPVKHPLENTWTLWYYRKESGKSWEDSLKEVGLESWDLTGLLFSVIILQIMSVSTVEDFWSVFNHIERVSKLQSGFDFSFFKKGIKPMWEDDANRRGGKWVVNFDKRQRIGGNPEVSLGSKVQRFGTRVDLFLFVRFNRWTIFGLR
jgi:translation initiation factor 4E